MARASLARMRNTSRRPPSTSGPPSMRAGIRASVVVLGKDGDRKDLDALAGKLLDLL